MKSYSADALVLRTYRYGEADRIVVFLTSDRGKKRGVAKNASKSRRRFGAALEPLTRGTVTYVEREHRELVRLDRIEPRTSPMGGTPEASRLAHGAYFAELLNEWAQDGQGNERLFRLGTSVGEAMERGGSIEALARYFEYWLLRLEGVYPAMDVCGRCGERTLGDGAVLATSDWHYVCQTCSPRGPQLSRAAMTFLKTAGARTPAEITAADVGAGALREIEHVHHHLIAMHLEKEVRSARVVKEMRSQA
jgi:DNA repair protein RecO (recombination protein O)